jgi:hypothetical protein
MVNYGKLKKIRKIKGQKFHISPLASAEKTSRKVEVFFIFAWPYLQMYPEIFERLKNQYV